ncbi:MAG: hypothetical protein NTW03_04060, partial [Verrucomicrobia bacterium]|nr:hypothetical protein [Verrucomicrobiota bacterium]
HGMDGSGTHQHRISGVDQTIRNDGNYNGNLVGGVSSYRGEAWTSWNGNHTHNIQNSGNGWPHNTMPPFYALAYIMRVY